MKRPKIGERIRSEDLGFVGTITKIIGYNQAFQWQTLPERIATNRQLREQLGSNFASMYFEVELLVEECWKGGISLGMPTMITWEEYQTTIPFPLDNPMKH